MTREEWNQVLATEAATSNQRGAIMCEFGRLGFHDERDRPERLAICAVLLGLDELSSTNDLVMGQAGQLVSILRGVRDRGELPEITACTADEASEDEPASAADPEDGDERLTFPQALVRLVAMSYIGWHGTRRGWPQH